MELISGILGNIKNILSLNWRQFSLFAICIAILAWSVLLLPKSVFVFLYLDDLRTNNLEKIGGLAFVATFIFVLGLLYKSVTWASSKLNARREKHQIHVTFQNLSTSELTYLYQYIQNRIMLIEFDETDPVVGLLCDKGLIYPSLGVRIGDNPVRYRSNYDYGQPFNILPFVYDYLVRHPELLAKVPVKKNEEKTYHSNPRT